MDRGPYICLQDGGLRTSLMLPSCSDGHGKLYDTSVRTFNLECSRSSHSFFRQSVVKETQDVMSASNSSSSSSSSILCFWKKILVIPDGTITLASTLPATYVRSIQKWVQKDILKSLLSTWTMLKCKVHLLHLNYFETFHRDEWWISRAMVEKHTFLSSGAVTFFII